MDDLGCTFPLYSFTFVPRPSTSPADPCEIAVPGGVLLVNDRLRDLGRTVTTERCLAALMALLAAHAALQGGLAGFGHGPAWAESMRFWAQRLLVLEARRLEEAAALQVAVRHREHLREEAAVLYRRLVLSCRLCAMPQPLLSGRPPRRDGDLLAALEQAAALLRDTGTARLLGTCGFGPGLQAHLAAVVAALRPHPQEQCALLRARDATAYQIITVRGALLGDLQRLGEIARGAGWPALARKLDLRRKLRPLRQGGRPWPGALPQEAGLDTP